MNKRLIYSFVLTVFIAISSVSCSQPIFEKELKFGIWASQNDLWDEAIYRWKKVLLSNPNSIAAHNNIAIAYEKKGLWEDAKKEYELALKLDPSNTYIKYNYQNFNENIKEVKKETDEKK